MLKTVKVTEPKEVASTMECDGCHAVYDFKKKEDMLEIQEFICLHRSTGARSLAGAGMEMHLDLCQRCVRSKLGDLMVIKDPATGEARHWSDPGIIEAAAEEVAPEEAEAVNEQPFVMQFPGSADGNPQEP